MGRGLTPEECIEEFSRLLLADQRFSSVDLPADAIAFYIRELGELTAQMRGSPADVTPLKAT